MSKKLIIKIRKDGVVEAETKGIKGQKCEDYLKNIEELTDSKVVKKRVHSRILWKRNEYSE